MTWPIATDYQEAIQNPRICFADPDLKGGTVKEDRFGLPVPISGMFASVYEVRTATGRSAVRCFLKPADDHQRRYVAIGAHLKSVSLKSAVGFHLIPEGIRIRSQWYPILKMEWIDGEPLNTFIAKNLGRPDRLLQLARDWVELMNNLRAVQIAHGDLQHGNILVTASGLRLIDYDGMYVPVLAGLTSHKKGHRNYQHPSRSGHDFGPYLDNFSAWVIFCSITAVALDSRIWQIVNGGDECLLFRRDDFQHPSRSRVFEVLERSRPEVRAVAAQFRSMLSIPIRQVPALDGKIIQQTAVPSPSHQVTQSAAAPTWLSDHVQLAPPTQPIPKIEEPEFAESPAAVAAADWIIDHLVSQQGPLPTFRARSVVLEHLVLLLNICILGAAGSAFLVSVLSLAHASLITVVAIAGYTVLLILRYGGASGIEERREAAAVLAAARVVLEQCQAEAKAAEFRRRKLLVPLDALRAEFNAVPSRVDEELRGVQGKTAQLRGAFARKRQEFAVEEAKALRAVEDDACQRSGPLQLERNSLDQREREEIAIALQVLRGGVVNNRLISATIDAATLPGIGPKLKASLKARGVRTAYDVDSRVLGVKGIGDAKAWQLMAWRNQLMSYSLPAALPQDQESHIRNKFAVRRQDLEQQIRMIEEAQRRQRQGILDRFAMTRSNFDQEERQAIAANEAIAERVRAKLQQEQVRLDSDYRAIKSKLAPVVAEHDKKLNELNRRTLQQRFEVCKLEKELERYKGISPISYLARIIGIRRLV